jgi:RimJ/RimL family protein N-acetyltransferase
MADGFTITDAGPGDIHAIRTIEADPRFEGLVGRWPAKRHRQEMALASSHYFLLRDDSGSVLGFALLQGVGDPDRKLHLKRIAVREPGAGHGSILLRGLLDRVYRETDVNRVDLDVFVGNDRARRAYEKAAFRLEGVLRDYHRNGDGSFSDMWLMSVLRRDWQSLSRPTDCPR